MPSLTGYPYSKAIVEAIFNQAPLDPAMEGPLLAAMLFQNNFMPYAKIHWEYRGAGSNCSDLSDAVCAAWTYIKTEKRPRHLSDPGRAAIVNVLGDCKEGLITRASLRVFNGPAHGNVRNVLAGALDGRCLFPRHDVCQIGGRYFDPTFDRSTPIPEDCVECRLLRVASGMNWLTKDHNRFYMFNPTPAPNFSNSYNEMSGTSYVTSEEWTAQTARGPLHARSKDLEHVDTALENFENAQVPDLAALKTAFEHWVTRNPKEAAARNGTGCVRKLMSFLGSTVDVDF